MLTCTIIKNSNNENFNFSDLNKYNVQAYWNNILFSATRSERSQNAAFYNYLFATKRNFTWIIPKNEALGKMYYYYYEKNQTEKIKSINKKQINEWINEQIHTLR